jgi:hypothetical protein
MSGASSIPAPSGGGDDDGASKKLIDDLCHKLLPSLQDQLKVLVSKHLESTIYGAIDSKLCAFRGSSQTPDSAIVGLLIKQSFVRTGSSTPSSSASIPFEIGSSDDGDPIIESIESHCSDENLECLLAGFDIAFDVK